MSGPGGTAIWNVPSALLTAEVRASRYHSIVIGWSPVFERVVRFPRRYKHQGTGPRAYPRETRSRGRAPGFPASGLRPPPGARTGRMSALSSRPGRAGLRGEDLESERVARKGIEGVPSVFVRPALHDVVESRQGDHLGTGRGLAAIVRRSHALRAPSLRRGKTAVSFVSARRLG